MLHVKNLDEGLEIFKALGSELRINIIKLLQENHEMNMNELATILQGNLDLFSSRIGENLDQEKGQAILKLAAKSIVSNIQMRLSGLLEE